MALVAVARNPSKGKHSRPTARAFLMAKTPGRGHAIRKTKVQGGTEKKKLENQLSLSMGVADDINADRLTKPYDARVHAAC